MPIVPARLLKLQAAAEFQTCTARDIYVCNHPSSMPQARLTCGFRPAGVAPAPRHRQVATARSGDASPGMRRQQLRMSNATARPTRWAWRFRKRLKRSSQGRTRISSSPAPASRFRFQGSKLNPPLCVTGSQQTFQVSRLSKLHTAKCRRQQSSQWSGLCMPCQTARHVVATNASTTCSHIMSKMSIVLLQ